jgi:hypothetical protein
MAELGRRYREVFNISYMKKSRSHRPLKAPRRAVDARFQYKLWALAMQADREYIKNKIQRHK